MGAIPGDDDITILLTRPRAQAERFARMLAGRPNALPDVLPVIIAPVIEIVFLPLPPLPADTSALIFTSENGVAAFAAQSPRRDLGAWCVGARTAEAAREAGVAARACGGDADALVRDLITERPAGKLAHVRGRHATGRLAARLTEAGLQVEELVAYDQRQADPGAALSALLARPGRVVAPLFSPRSARLLAQALTAAADAPRARVVPVAISAAAAEVWADSLGGPLPAIASRPNAEAMCEAIEAAIRTIRSSSARPA